MAVLARNIWGGHGVSPNGEHGSASLYEGLGAEPPAGSRGRAPGQGARGRSSPEAEALLVFGRSMEVANLAAFLKFGKAKNQKILLFLQ